MHAMTESPLCMPPSQTGVKLEHAVSSAALTCSQRSRSPCISSSGSASPPSPLATAIAGGVLGSAVLALVLSPSLYVGMRRRDAKRVARRIQRNAARREAAAAAPPSIRAAG